MSDQITTEVLRRMHAAAHVAAQDAERKSYMAQFDLDSEIQTSIRRQIIAVTSAATPQDYGRFLALYLRAGGQPTHFYDYPMSRREFRLVTEPLEIRPLYGALGLDLLVLPNVGITGSGGHINLYRMDDPLASRFVPIYSDSEVSE